jgi:DNA polymerase III subunit chi
MGVVMFYHLTRSSTADTVQSLVSRALAQGWRVMIRGTDHAALDRLDARLWLGPDDDFVPHGLQGGPLDADQPVLIGQGGVANGAQALALLDGATATPDEIAAMERVWVLFDGADEARLHAARLQWKALTSTGITAQYWAEDSGRWEKKATSGPAPGA